jgi:hypothetical protein
MALAAAGAIWLSMMALNRFRVHVLWRTSSLRRCYGMRHCCLAFMPRLQGDGCIWPFRFTGQSQPPMPKIRRCTGLNMRW